MTASDQAYVHTKERILDGRFAQGELISEGEVSVGVGVSRTPVREAFLRLEAEGLLRLYPKRGALVVPISASDVENVMDTRLLIERFAAERIIKRGLDLGDELGAAIAEQQELAAAGDHSAFVEADRGFHRILVAATGNRILLHLHDSLRDQQHRMGLAALARSESRLDRILQEHRLIADAVVSGDAEGASTLIEQHLYGTLQLLRGSPGL